MSQFLVMCYGELFDNRLTAERRSRYNVRVQDKEDIIDDLCGFGLLDDDDSPSCNWFAIVFVVVAVCFIACLVL